jgi:hypothetical protein
LSELKLMIRVVVSYEAHSSVVPTGPECYLLDAKSSTSVKSEVDVETCVDITNPSRTYKDLFF